MKWKLINPSDDYVMECDIFKAAAIAVTLLGEGKYALNPIEDTDPNFKVPIFMFDDPDKWFKIMFSETLKDAYDDCMATKKASLIAALRSVNITDEARTSMNDIGSRAQSIADSVEKK